MNRVEGAVAPLKGVLCTCPVQLGWEHQQYAKNSFKNTSKLHLSRRHSMLPGFCDCKAWVCTVWGIAKRRHDKHKRCVVFCTVSQLRLYCISFCLLSYTKILLQPGPYSEINFPHSSQSNIMSDCPSAYMSAYVLRHASLLIAVVFLLREFVTNCAIKVF